MPAPGRALRRLWALLADPGFCRRSAALAVAALAVGIVSGGAVRLTGSGLGCSDWPSCTATSVVAPLQFHAWVEFGNRLVNVVLTLGMVLAVVASLRRLPRRADLIVLSLGLVGGILAEIVLGGETVLHKLAPQFVMAHFLLAVVLLVNALVLYHRAGQPDGAPAAGRKVRPLPARCLVRRGHLWASRGMLALTFVVVVLGTIVTSTGPHAGAPGVPRFGYSLHAVAQLHGTAVELLLALTVATLWSMHRGHVAPAVLRRGEVLLVVLVAQAAVGYSQYLSGDPVLLVGVHLAGATSVVIAMVFFNLGLYTRDPVPTVKTIAGDRRGAKELART
ncbi:MAG: COX15/CtaA family protein [Acidimicrobiales bacterium]|jgi:cytochrome c oxidase assembly protein subunit 15